MSYIRAGYKGTYEAVDLEITEDYAFLFQSREPTLTETNEDTWLVEDYGSISNNGLVEIFYRRYVRNKTGEEKVLGLYLLSRLSQKLGVPIKKKFQIPYYWDKYKQDEVYDPTNEDTE